MIDTNIKKVPQEVLKNYSKELGRKYTPITTQREFKREKRIDFDIVYRSFRKFRFASVFLPGNSFKMVVEVRRLLEEIKKEISAKNWGR